MCVGREKLPLHSDVHATVLAQAGFAMEIGKIKYKQRQNKNNSDNDNNNSYLLDYMR